MEITIRSEEVAQLTGAAEAILRIIGYAQGRADSYAARREECRLITFPSIEKSPAESGTNYLPKGIEHDSETDCRPETPFYSPQEVKRLPKLKDGKYRKTKDGLHQIRYRREGYDKQFTSKDLKTVKEEFREWVKSINGEKKAIAPKKRQDFGSFAVRYFETVKRANVSLETFESQFACLKRHILPRFGDALMRDITPLKCQELLNGLLTDGKGRTAESLKFILGEVFRAAIGERLISDNPMKYVKLPKYQKKHGSALTSEDLREFFKECKKSYYRKQFMLYLYTGIRRNEIHSAVFDENFVTVACGKCRKGERQQYRKIPIAPELRAFLPISEKELAADNKVLTRAFKRMLPNHHLHDLRHTFTTYALQSGIPKALVDVWTGHVNRSDMTTTVYTHFSEEYQLREIAKLTF